eukprot:scaffold9678_cov79-Cyclotella_meneghiniana.AAC.5
MAAREEKQWPGCTNYSRLPGPLRALYRSVSEHALTLVVSWIPYKGDPITSLLSPLSPFNK